MKSAQGFGAVDGAALVVATVVGAGIFTVPSLVAKLAGSPALVLSLWVIGGLVAMAGALSYAELAARFPRGGAEYVYIREAFGPTAAFLSGWTSFIAGFSGAIAAAAVGFGAYLSALVPALAPYTTAVALAIIAVFTIISIAGVRASRVATNALAVLIIAGMVTIVVASVLGVSPRTATVSVASGSGAMSALVPIFFTYSGWNAAAYVAGEFRNPSKSVPRALIGGTLIVTVLYVALNVALMRTLSTSGLAESTAPVTAASRGALGPIGELLVGLLVLVALASSVCAMVITGPRIYREMAEDGVLPRVFARSSARDGVPAFAVVVQSLWSGVLVVSGTFEQIVTYTGFAIVLFSGLAVCSLFVLRRRLGAPASYRVPGYPVVPAAFIVAVSVIAVGSFRYAPGPSLVGIALIFAGLPILLLGSRLAARRQSAH